MRPRRAPLASAAGLLWRAVFAVLLITGCATTAAAGDPVAYRRTGGLGGTALELSIDAEGQATLSIDGRTSEFTVPLERLGALHEALDEADLQGLTPAPAGASGRGRDLFEYEITYRGQTARTRDTQVPPELAPALSALNAIVAEQGGAE